MDKHFVYILYSSRIDKFYVGYSENPDERLKFHNSSFNNIWSKRGQPWVLKIIIPFPFKKEAIVAEKKIKSFKSKSVIKKIIEEGWRNGEAG